MLNQGYNITYFPGLMAIELASPRLFTTKTNQETVFNRIRQTSWQNKISPPEPAAAPATSHENPLVVLGSIADQKYLRSSRPHV